MIGVTVEVHSLVIGSPSEPIHMVDLPVHSPASLARSSCILPGVPAAIQAFMSSMVQPAGSLISGWPAGVPTLAASAAINEPTSAAIPAVATSAGTTSLLQLIETSNWLKECSGLDKGNYYRSTIRDSARS